MLDSDHSAFSSGSPFTRLLTRGRLAMAWVALELALGCKPQIGDDCTVSTNCSTTGDRLCDITQPGGYCTTFNCEPGSCPDNSVCVNFGTNLSLVVDDMHEPVKECRPSQANSPYKRSFCMANCSSNSDCRDGYACQAPEEFYAVLAEHKSGQKVCAVPQKEVHKNSTEVCVGSDAGPAEGGSSSVAGGGSGGGAGTADGGSAGSPEAGGEE